MKRILIYTYKHSNYGAVLQAYALQKYLVSTYDAEVKVVDFTTDSHLKGDKLIKTSGSILERVIYTFFNILHRGELKRRIARTQLFKNKYYNQTDRYKSVEQLINNNPSADIYITGSDQVFNPHSSFLPVYYLGFKKGAGIKVAYAPSFGISSFTPEITERIKPYLIDFNFLSCRETVGAEYLSSILNKEVPTVCDPTMLLKQSEWSVVAQQPRFKGDYILVYEINGGANIIRLAKKIGAEKNLPIVCITSKTHKHYYVNKIIRDAGPAEFVGWFKNASYVVTDSFHGTVFSWIFKKDFFYFLAYEATSSRARTLLKHIGCEERIVKLGEIPEFSLSNYKPYNKIVPPIIQDSKNYIDSFVHYAEE